MILNLVNFFCERAVQICIMLWTCPRTRKQKSKMVEKIANRIVLFAYFQLALGHELSWFTQFTEQNFLLFRIPSFLRQHLAKKPKITNYFDHLVFLFSGFCSYLKRNQNEQLSPKKIQEWNKSWKFWDLCST